MSTSKEIEAGKQFTPKFDQNGLITAICQDAATGHILMVAYMNRESLEETIQTRHAVFFSRSRQRLWRKGEQSGHFQEVLDILVDCDQDCLVLKVKVTQGQCHVGYQSCFYRKIDMTSPENLQFISDKVYDPQQTYSK